MKATRGGGLTPSQLISNQIAELDDWRGELLARLRGLILKAAPEIREEWKWDTAVWSQNGLDAKATRAIDFYEGDKVNESALNDLIRAAVLPNTSGGKTK